MSEPFKTCPFCLNDWPSRDAFLSDGELVLVGYQVDFEELTLGLFLFNHTVCNTTLAIRAGLFKDLYFGPVFRKRRTGQPDCQGYCLKTSQLAACPAQCECAWVRELLQTLRQWPKNMAKTRRTMR